MNYIKRQIVLDTETTGMNKFGSHYKGHRIIEIGAIEIINRYITGKYFHVYLNPERLIDKSAYFVHGINNKFLLNKPKFNNIYNKFIKFIFGAELIIHNACFDIGFINNELCLNNKFYKIENICNIKDTLKMSRRMFPGKKNTLDALCDRYFINRSNRIFHGALLDAKILTKIFLLMTGGQQKIKFDIKKKKNIIKKKKKYIINKNIYNFKTKIIYAKKNEIICHKNKLNLIFKKSGVCL